MPSSIDPAEALRRVWGFESFRPLQEEAVRAALAGRDALVVLPTGGGKSLCYQLPAACGAGLVLVISPLIALMDDQVAAAREVGIRAGALHSNADPRRKRQVRDALDSGELELLYASPERIAFGDLLPCLRERAVLVAVDEAHCVSHWGHEFRPEYRQLRPVLDALPRAGRLALTATATAPVQDDVIEQLGLREPLRLVGHPDRPNLIYRAVPRHDQSRQVLSVIERHRGEGGIVYAQTRAEVERLAKTLAREGLSCAPYHAGLPGGERAKTQDAFVNERLDVVVATIAFGMGIDRSNVRFVVHANSPRSMEHYQQEAGRAGRDGMPAECVLFFSAGDLQRHRMMATRDDLSPERRRTLEKQLKEIGRFAVAPVCRHRLLSEHFGAAWSGAAEGCGACDVCLGETRELPEEEARVTAQKIISAVYRTGGRFGAGYVVNLLLGKVEPRMERNGHDRLRVCGILKEPGEAAVRAWVDQLLVQGQLVVVEDGEYPLLQTTDVGMRLCRNEGSVRLGAPTPAVAKKKGAKKRAATGAAPAAVAAELGDDAADLFERLRRLRRALAAKMGVPPYLVAHDSVLAAVAAARPADIAGLHGIKGIGERKLRRYGNALLRVVAGEDPETVAAGVGEGEGT